MHYGVQMYYDVRQFIRDWVRIRWYNTLKKMSGTRAEPYPPAS